MISAIVAVDNDWGIGFNGELLEHIPEDLKYFKELTMNNIIVMGRKTWESLPKRPLPNRFNIVICHTDMISYHDGAVFCSLGDIIGMMKFSQEKDTREWFIIGGGQIYKQLLPYCEKVYVTKIYKKHENIDAFFPNLDETDDWKATPVSDVREYNDISYQFWIYERV